MIDTIAEILIAGLPLTPFLTWPAAWVLGRAVRRHPHDRILLTMASLAIVIASLTTIYALMAIAQFVHFTIDREGAAILLTLPVYLLAAISGAFLWLYWRGEW